MIESSKSNQLSDLDWQAFQYAANELDESAREAFELRLESDPFACEALARAVELSATIRAAESLSPVAIPRGSQVWQLRLSWLAAGATVAAACMALVSAPQWLSKRTTVATASIDTELAVAWSSTLPVVSPGAVPHPQESPLAGDSTSTGVDMIPAEDGLPPSWMLLALQGLAEEDHDLNADSDMNLNIPFVPDSLDN